MSAIAVTTDRKLCRRWPPCRALSPRRGGVIGSPVARARIGADFVHWPPAPDDRALGLVDFSIFPHLDVFPGNSQAEAERWAADIAGPAYALDDQTAITVVDGVVDVVSEGHWKFFPA